MARTRISTTVDEQLLAEARRTGRGLNDAALLDEALTAFLARRRSVEIDRAYEVYDERPLSEPDEWGDLDSFHRAAASS